MGKEIGRSFKYNQSNISTPTLKKPVLSSSAAHTPYTSNLTWTIISSQLENEDSNTIQTTTETSNTDDIHSCVTQQQNYSVQAKSTPSRLTPLNTTLSIAPVELHKTKNYPRLVKNLFVYILTVNILILPSVSNHGYLISPLVLSYPLIHLNNNLLWLNLCYNHHILKIIWRLLVLTNHYAPGILFNTDVWTTSKIYINMQVSVTTNKTSRIL